MKKRQNPERAKTPIQTAAPAVSSSLFFNGFAAALIAFLAYLPALRNGFVNWDDDATIVNNPLLARMSWENIFAIFDLERGSAGLGNYNPLTIFSFYLERWVSGSLNPTLIHFDNVLLHALAVFLVFRVLRAMDIGAAGAFVGALLFGIHPMRVESVAWATERKDVLFAVFFFAALLYYIRWLKSAETGSPERRFYLLAILLALLSCLSKVQAVTLPLSMLALDYWFRRPFNMRLLVLEKAPFWLLALLFGLINVYTLRIQGVLDDSMTGFSLPDRLCIGAWSYCVYLYKLLIPYPMLPFYAYPKQLPVWMYLSPLLFAGSAYLVWRWHRSEQRTLVFGFLFFLFNVLFLLQIQTAGQGFLADRFTYVPYFGFFAIAAFYFDRTLDTSSARRNWNRGLLGLSLLYLVMTYAQIAIWKDSATLWTKVIRHEGQKSGLPHWYRGQYYRTQGQYETALADYQNALAQEPQNPELLNSRGKTYFDMGVSGKYPKDKLTDFLKKALDDYNSSLNFASRVSPSVKAAMFINRGAALGTFNQLEPAMQDFNQGLQLDSMNKTGYMNRASLYLKLRQPAAALQDFEKYLKLDPGNARVRQERDKLQRVLQQNK